MSRSSHQQPHLSDSPPLSTMRQLFNAASAAVSPSGVARNNDESIDDYHYHRPSSVAVAHSYASSSPAIPLDAAQKLKSMMLHGIQQQQHQRQKTDADISAIEEEEEDADEASVDGSAHEKAAYGYGDDYDNEDFDNEEFAEDEENSEEGYYDRSFDAEGDREKTASETKRGEFESPSSNFVNLSDRCIESLDFEVLSSLRESNGSGGDSGKKVTPAEAASLSRVTSLDASNNPSLSRIIGLGKIFSNLTILDLSHCGLQFLSSNASSSLHDSNEHNWVLELPRGLVSLNLCHNKISADIVEDTPSSLSSPPLLHSSNCNGSDSDEDGKAIRKDLRRRRRMGWIAATFLQFLPRLESLDLSHNALSSVKLPPPSPAATSNARQNKEQSKQGGKGKEDEVDVGTHVVSSALRVLSLAHNAQILHVGAALFGIASPAAAAGGSSSHTTYRYLSEIHLQGNAIARIDAGEAAAEASAAAAKASQSQQQNRSASAAAHDESMTMLSALPSCLDTAAIAVACPALRSLFLAGNPVCEIMGDFVPVASPQSNERATNHQFEGPIVGDVPQYVHLLSLSPLLPLPSSAATQQCETLSPPFVVDDFSFEPVSSAMGGPSTRFRFVGPVVESNKAGDEENYDESRVEHEKVGQGETSVNFSNDCGYNDDGKEEEALLPPHSSSVHLSDVRNDTTNITNRSRTSAITVEMDQSDTTVATLLAAANSRVDNTSANDTSSATAATKALLERAFGGAAAKPVGNDDDSDNSNIRRRRSPLSEHNVYRTDDDDDEFEEDENSVAAEAENNWRDEMLLKKEREQRLLKKEEEARQNEEVMRMLEEALLAKQRSIQALTHEMRESDALIATGRHANAEALREIIVVKNSVKNLQNRIADAKLLIKKRQREIEHVDVTARRLQEKSLAREQSRVEAALAYAERKRRGMESMMVVAASDGGHLFAADGSAAPPAAADRSYGNNNNKSLVKSGEGVHRLTRSAMLRIQSREKKTEALELERREANEAQQLLTLRASQQRQRASSSSVGNNGQKVAQTRSSTRSAVGKVSGGDSPDVPPPPASSSDRRITTSNRQISADRVSLRSSGHLSSQSPVGVADGTIPSSAFLVGGGGNGEAKPSPKMLAEGQEGKRDPSGSAGRTRQEEKTSQHRPTEKKPSAVSANRQPSAVTIGGGGHDRTVAPARPQYHHSTDLMPTRDRLEHEYEGLVAGSDPNIYSGVSGTSGGGGHYGHAGPSDGFSDAPPSPAHSPRSPLSKALLEKRQLLADEQKALLDHEEASRRGAHSRIQSRGHQHGHHHQHNTLSFSSALQQRHNTAPSSSSRFEYDAYGNPTLRDDEAAILSSAEGSYRNQHPHHQQRQLHHQRSSSDATTARPSDGPKIGAAGPANPAASDSEAAADHQRSLHQQNQQQQQRRPLSKTENLLAHEQLITYKLLSAQEHAEATRSVIYPRHTSASASAASDIDDGFAHLRVEAEEKERIAAESRNASLLVEYQKQLQKHKMAAASGVLLPFDNLEKQRKEQPSATVITAGVVVSDVNHTYKHHSQQPTMREGTVPPVSAPQTSASDANNNLVQNEKKSTYSDAPSAGQQHYDPVVFSNSTANGQIGAASSSTAATVAPTAAVAPQYRYVYGLADGTKRGMGAVGVTSASSGAAHPRTSTATPTITAVSAGNTTVVTTSNNRTTQSLIEESKAIMRALRETMDFDKSAFASASASAALSDPHRGAASQGSQAYLPHTAALTSRPQPNGGATNSDVTRADVAHVHVAALSAGEERRENGSNGRAISNADERHFDSEKTASPPPTDASPPRSPPASSLLPRGDELGGGRRAFSNDKSPPPILHAVVGGSRSPLPKSPAGRDGGILAAIAHAETLLNLK